MFGTDVNECSEDFNTTSIEVIAPTALEIYSPLLEVPQVDDSGDGLNEAAANLLLLTTGTTLEWTEACGPDGTEFECTLTAPTPNAYGQTVLATLAKAGIINDGDCDSDDTILFIPKGCDLFFTTGAIGNNPLTAGDTNSELFSPDETVTSESFGVPEPGTVTLLLARMLGLFAFRRKYAL